jgi:hypothetical protein
LKLISFTSCPTSGAGALALGGENPKSPSRAYSAAARRTGPPTNDFGTKSMPVNDESAASSASGAVIGAGGNASTSAIGTSYFRMFARLAGVQKLGGLPFGALEYAWEKLRLSQVYAGHHPHNRASEKILKKLGFEFIGNVFYEPTGLMHPSYVGKAPPPRRNTSTSL